MPPKGKRVKFPSRNKLMFTDAVKKALSSPAMTELEESVLDILRAHPDVTVADIEYDPHKKKYILKVERYGSSNEEKQRGETG